MGIGQQAASGLATTMLAAGAMVGKVSADIDKANTAKIAESEKLQENFLDTNEQIEAETKAHQNVSDLINTAEMPDDMVAGDNEMMTARDNARQELNDKFTDMSAAKRAQQNLADKVEAMKEKNERTAERFQKLTGQEIIGGNK